MNSKSYSSRKKNSYRFKPTTKGTRRRALGSKATKAAEQARQDVLEQTSGDEPVFSPSRHEDEINRAENLAHRLPADIDDETLEKVADEECLDDDRADESATREPIDDIERNINNSRTIVSKVTATARKAIKKVKKIIHNVETETDVIINVESLETRVAILEEGKLEEFNIERTDSLRMAGSIYKGIVRNLEDGLKAAFVDIGWEKNSFLHYWDIVPNNLDKSFEVVEREKDKGRKKKRKKITQKDIPELYPPGAEIIVQVTKGPIGTKGPRVTTNLSIPGRYLVLLPNSDQSGISRKIESQEERQRLKRILNKLTIPEGMGVVMRTAGEGKKLRYFVRDLAWLLEQWKSIQDKISNTKAPSCVYQEPDLIGRTVRDFLTDEINKIVVDDADQYKRIRDLVEKISKRSVSKVVHYNDMQSVFDRFNVTRQLESTFARQVHLKSGGYIVFDETEALVAVDVNTGRHKNGKDQTSTMLNVNLEAAEEICRQLRLRNIGGLIVLDFIDMKMRRDQNEVYKKVREHLRKDRAKTHVLPISPLGLMQMTRQRHSESVHSKVYDTCPYCQGKGVIKSPITMSAEIQRKLGEILKRRGRDETDFQLRISVHPRVLERLRKEDEELLIQLEKKYFGKLSFRADNNLLPEQFRITNVETNKDLVKVQ
jgi:ribonuclease G